MALTAAPEDQALLLELQALDSRLQQLAGRAARLPEAEQLAALGGEQETIERELAEKAGLLEDARLELTRVEADVAVVEARIVRDRERLATSSSVKDVEALEQELAALARRQRDLEDIQLTVMETVDEHEAATAAVEERRDAQGSRIAAAAAARDAALAQIEDDRIAATAARAGLVVRIPAELLALYEKQRERYGIGASHLQRGVSSASGVALNATDLEAVRNAAPDAVILCPDSNAILVRTEESGL